MQLDVTEGEASIKAKADKAAALWGRIDVLVNNAGKFRYLDFTLLHSGFGRRSWASGPRRRRRVSRFFCPFDNIYKITCSRSAHLRRQYETNVFGLMDVTTAFLPHLRCSTLNPTMIVVGSRSVWKPELPVSATGMYGF